MSKNENTNFFTTIFKSVFYGSLGSFAAGFVIVLFSLAFIIPGAFLIKKYNKKDSKTFEELQTEQYLGIGLCVIGILPWLRFIFAGFGLEAGESLFENLVE